MFIRGFRVARTFGILPKHLKAAAGPSSDTGGYGYEPDTEVVSIPAAPKVKVSLFFSPFKFIEVSKNRDPLHMLLDYIVEVRHTGLASYLRCVCTSIITWTTQRAPDCDMFLIHDDDLKSIDGIGDGAVSGYLISILVFSSHGR